MQQTSFTNCRGGGGLRLPRLIRRPLSCLLGGGESTLDSSWAAGPPRGDIYALRQDSWSFRRGLQFNEAPEARPVALVANGNSRSCCGRTEQRTVVLNRRGASFGFSLVGGQPVRVGRVEPSSAAEAAGLRVGDAIVGAAGRIVLASGCETLVRRIRSGGSRLELRIQRWLSNCSSWSDNDEPDRAAPDRDFEADEEDSDASSSLELSSLYRATEGAQPIRASQQTQAMYYPFRPLPSQLIRAMNPEQARLYPPAEAAHQGFQPYQNQQCHQPNRSQEMYPPIRNHEMHQQIRNHEMHQPIRSQEIHQPIGSQEMHQPIRSQEMHQPIRATEN
uniref:PDZ domain-containing protein n=1 Tax=Macrostomum lignano TaxID=282301 RepID=A0A1I8GRI4_9PLAT